MNRPDLGKLVDGVKRLLKRRSADDTGVYDEDAPDEAPGRMDAMPDSDNSPFAKFRRRLLDEVGPGVADISVREGDGNLFDDQAGALVADLRDTFDTRVLAPKKREELSAGALVDVLIARVNRALAQAAREQNVPLRNLVCGRVIVNLRPGDRHVVLVTDGSNRSRRTVADDLYAHTQRETGGGATLKIVGAQIAEQTVAEFFGADSGSNGSGITAQMEQAFVDCMVSTTRQVPEYVVRVLVAPMEQRRRILSQLLSSRERKNARGLASELLHNGTSKPAEYIVYDPKGSSEVGPMMFLEPAPVVVGRLIDTGSSRNFDKKQAELTEKLEEAIRNGVRFFRVTS
ncbi:MAG: hypothetical protein AAB592_04305 [Patescibacteria group bacterium]